jgi:hypothetical protein
VWARRVGVLKGEWIWIKGGKVKKHLDGGRIEGASLRWK